MIFLGHGPDVSQKISLMLRNIKKLPGDVFDEQDNIRSEITLQIKKMLPLMKKEFLSFLKMPLQDIIFFGDLCSSVCGPDSDIKIGFVVQTSLPFEVLQNINFSLSKRGFDFKIYKHQVKFYIVTPEDLEFANWSIIKNHWNKKPQIKDFDFSFISFFDTYSNLTDELSKILSNLKRNSNGFYNKESRDIIQAYLLKFEKTFRTNDIYSLNYQLVRALDLFNIRQNLEKEIIAAECDELKEQKNA